MNDTFDKQGCDLAVGCKTAGVGLRLRNAGLRPTRQRLALGALLFGSGDRHVSAEMLHLEALNTGEQVSLATVYNTLHQFTEAGMLRELAIEGGKAYFDTNISNHNHFFVEHEGRRLEVGKEALLAGIDGILVKDIAAIRPPPSTVLGVGGRKEIIALPAVARGPIRVVVRDFVVAESIARLREVDPGENAQGILEIAVLQLEEVAVFLRRKREEIGR